jgi:hypothetical protein
MNCICLVLVFAAVVLDMTLLRAARLNSVANPGLLMLAARVGRIAQKGRASPLHPSNTFDNRITVVRLPLVILVNRAFENRYSSTTDVAFGAPLFSTQ